MTQVHLAPTYEALSLRLNVSWLVECRQTDVPCACRAERSLDLVDLILQQSCIIAFIHPLPHTSKLVAFSSAQGKLQLPDRSPLRRRM